MSHGFWGATRWMPVFGLAALSSVQYREAAACSPIEYGQFLDRVTDAVPANGVVVAHIMCSDCEEDTAVNLSVRDADDVLIEGEIVESRIVAGGGWVAWHSAAPLTEGATYNVELDGPKVRVKASRFEFEAKAESTESAPPDVPSVSVRAYVAHRGEDVCCQDSELDSCGEVSCFQYPESGEVQVYVSSELLASDSADRNSQFVWRARMYNAAQDLLSEWSPTAYLSGNFDPADEYCYELQARHILSGTVTTLESSCFDSSDVVLPDVAAELEDQREGSLRTCTKPPVGYEAQWCAAFDDQVNAGGCGEDAPSSCLAAVEACSPGTDTSEHERTDAGTPDAGAGTEDPDVGAGAEDPVDGGATRGEPIDGGPAAVDPTDARAVDPEHIDAAQPDSPAPVEQDELETDLVAHTQEDPEPVDAGATPPNPGHDDDADVGDGCSVASSPKPAPGGASSSRSFWLSALGALVLWRRSARRRSSAEA